MKKFRLIIACMLIVSMVSMVSVHPYAIDASAPILPEPSASEISAALDIALSKGHPYLFGTKADFERISSLAFGKDEFLTKQYALIKEEASRYVSMPPETTDVSKSYITSGFNAAWDIVPKCAFVYLIEGDTAYAQRAWQEAECFAKLDSWGTYQSIDNNQAALIVAICYDWLYDYLNKEQRDMLFTALRTNHLDTVLELYKNPNDEKFNTSFHQYYFSTNNHGTVNNCSTFIEALSIADRDKDFSAQLMSYALKHTNNVVENMYPDSAWSEGLGYWNFVGPLLARMLLSMKSAFGHCFDYDENSIIMNCGYFPIYITSSYGQFLYNDTEGYDYKENGCDKFILGYLSADRAIQKYAMQNDNLSHPFACLVYEPGFDYMAASDATLEKDRLFSNCDIAVMRDSWNTNQEVFAGMVVQDANAPHGHMNSGTIAYDALGERWVTNPGRDDYSLPGYFWHEERWQYYCTRAEANSCVVINPSSYGGQNPDAGDTIGSFESSAGESFAIADLTNTYSGQVTSYKRGIRLMDNRKRFVVQDEMKLEKASEVYSFINVYKADIQISDSGKEIILSKGDKKVKLTVASDKPYTVSVMDSVPLASSPNPEGQANFKDIKKLAFRFENITALNMAVSFVPYVSGDDLFEYDKDSVIPMDDWSVTDSEILSPSLNDLKINGETVEGFMPQNSYYEYFSDDDNLQIEAFADDAYDVSIKHNQGKSYYYITVSDKNNEDNRKNIYIFNYKRQLQNAQEAYFVDESGSKSVSAFSSEAVDGESMVIYKIKLPQLKSGEKLSQYKFRFAMGIFYTSTYKHKPEDVKLALYKMPREITNLEGLKYSSEIITQVLSDKQKYRVSDYEVFKASAGVTDGGIGAHNVYHFMQSDLTDYANECIENNQSYLYIAVASVNIRAKFYAVTDGYNAGCGARALMDFKSDSQNLAVGKSGIVFAESEASNFNTQSFVSERYFTPGTEVRALAEIENNTSDARDVILIAASYSNGELTYVDMEQKNIAANSVSVAQSRSFIIQPGTSLIKIMIWDGGKFGMPQTQAQYAMVG